MSCSHVCAERLTCPTHALPQFNISCSSWCRSCCRSCLHHALYWGHLGLAARLLAAGAPLHLADHQVSRD